MFTRTLASMALLWLAFPPVGWAPLAWVCLIPLLSVAALDQDLGRWGYRKIYFAGVLYWLATFYFIPIPHPALWVGWLVISIYLGVYLPVFVGATRGLNHRLRIPFFLSAAVCWTGLELVRNYLLTGMGLVCLSHSQFRQPLFLQICDLSGGYTLTFAIVATSAGIYTATVNLCARRWLNGLTTASAIILMIAGTVFYGQHKLKAPASDRPPLSVGLIQGSMDTNLLATREDMLQFWSEKTEQYQRLNREGILEWDQVDVVIWPENAWPYPDLHPETDLRRLSSEQLGEFRRLHEQATIQLFVPRKKTPEYLVGALSFDPIKEDSYGSVLHIDTKGRVKNRYFKNHLVMFGEYLPFADRLSALAAYSPIGKGLIAGTAPVSITCNGYKLTPNICFESTVPHYIRSQVCRLRDQGEEPDVLVNVTNDGWFYGTSCLDFHLACNVFRAVEMRKPHLVAANTGLSAHVDACGRIQQQGPRRRTDTILATVETVDLNSIYAEIGDLIPSTMAAITIFGALLACLRPHSRREPSATDQQRLDDAT